MVVMDEHPQRYSSSQLKKCPAKLGSVYKQS